MNDSKKAGRHSDRQLPKQQPQMSSPADAPSTVEEPWDAQLRPSPAPTSYRFKKSPARANARKRAVRSLDFPWGW